MEASRDAILEPAEYHKPWSRKAPPDEDFNPGRKREIAALQLRDHLAARRIKCAKCSDEYQLQSLYRCRFCGVWYCHRCADVHFGPARNIAGHEEKGNNTTKLI